MNAKILVVDDERSVLKVLRKFLESAGYECHTSSNGEEAIDALNSQSFDLLLSDLQMAGTSGLDLIRYAKKHHPKVGRIMITGYGTPEIANEIMNVGVYGYLIKPVTKNVVQITVGNALRHLRLDLHMLACKEELEQKVLHRTEKLSAIMDNINVGVVMINRDLQVVELNKKMSQFFPEISPDIKFSCCNLCKKQPEKTVCNDCHITQTYTTGKACEVVCSIPTESGKRDFRIVTSPVSNASGLVYSVILLYEDITEKQLLERDLQQAQKLEAVGQLAAGIAHEINTPIQFVGDNVSFLKDSFEDLGGVLETYSGLWQGLNTSGSISEEMNKQLMEALDEADMEYLQEEIPKTINQSLDGVRRVDKIVKAMKAFSHPGTDEKMLADINKVLESTITVCKNEWKYVAEMNLDLSPDLSLVPCFSSQISQAFLNIIVNSAHAISAVMEEGKKGMGKISVSTKMTNGGVQILIADTGGGIPEAILDRVFDPFFTTKERGKGTGQGLSIAHRVVVDKHQGHITIKTEPGEGTTFVIELPVGEEE